MKERRKVTRSTANLRTITDGEIVVEFDSDKPMRTLVLTRRIVRKLKGNNYSFVIWKAQGQRSAHIHIYDIKGLDKLDKDVNREYKRLWFEKYANWNEADDSINTKSSNLLAMENRPHFKYGTIKDLISSYNLEEGISNQIELKLLKQAKKRVLEHSMVKNITNKLNNSYDNTWFIKWITNEKLPEGTRNNIILKNLAIHMENNNINDIEILNKLAKFYNNKVYNLIHNWRRWASGKDKFFGIGEIIRFCEENNFNLNDIFAKYRDDMNGNKINGDETNVIRKNSKK